MLNAILRNTILMNVILLSVIVECKCYVSYAESRGIIVS
jgi:hypothetical protein